MTLADDRSPRAYEREADETRRRLSTSLDELASNLTPGRMLDEVLSYARAGGGDFLRGLGNAASANPMPTLSDRHRCRDVPDRQRSRRRA